MKTINVNHHRFQKYLSHRTIVARVKSMAKELEKELKHLYPIFLPVLNGSFMFASDLLKDINIPGTVSFIKVASYRGKATTGNVKEVIGLTESLENRHVVIIEDIIDTGITMTDILAQVEAQHPASVRVVTFLFKKVCLKRAITPDHVGFEVPDLFVVGYGLDYDGYGRNFRHLYALASESQA